MRRELVSGLVALTASTWAVTGRAQEEQPRIVEEQEQQQTEQDAPLEGYEEGASVILSGTIERLNDDDFVLDYGEDKVQVNLEDWDWGADIEDRLREGQQVTVSGTVDDDWFEKRELDADNIYVTTDYTYYYIVDENPAYTAQENERQTQQDGTFLSTRGEVTEVSEDKITVESQGNTIQVDLSDLAYDPLDEQGVQRIKQGDRVYVFGDIDENFFEDKTMSAESLITLSQAGQAQGQMQDQQPQQSQDLQRPGQQQDQPDVRQPNQQNQQPTPEQQQ